MPKRKKKSYKITVYHSNKGDRRPLRGNTTGTWKPLKFKSKKEAMSQIKGMSPDTIRVYQPKVETW